MPEERDKRVEGGCFGKGNWSREAPFYYEPFGIVHFIFEAIHMYYFDEKENLFLMIKINNLLNL